MQQTKSRLDSERGFAVLQERIKDAYYFTRVEGKTWQELYQYSRLDANMIAVMVGHGILEQLQVKGQQARVYKWDTTEPTPFMCRTIHKEALELARRKKEIRRETGRTMKGKGRVLEFVRNGMSEIPEVKTKVREVERGQDQRKPGWLKRFLRWIWN